MSCPFPDKRFYRTEWDADSLIMNLNESHDFFHSLVQPLKSSPASGLMVRLEMALLALGRAERADWSEEEKIAIDRFIGEWSRNMTVFVGMQ
jgi:hypothetical protein